MAKTILEELAKIALDRIFKTGDGSHFGGSGQSGFGQGANPVSVHFHMGAGGDPNAIARSQGQIAAAIAMGADAVTIGTRMTVAEEIWAHPAYKQRMVEADETSSRLVLASLRNTYRVLDNRDARAVAELEAAGVSDHASYRELVAGMRQKEAYETGDWQRGVLSMGQSIAFARAIKPVAAIFAELVGEARAALERVRGVTAQE